jgi:predicted MFS family arabinose efflux permease
MSTAFRLFVSLAIVAAGVIVLMGPRWRGEFYRSWLRPRLLAFAILLTVFTFGLYLFRVYNSLHVH